MDAGTAVGISIGSVAVTLLIMTFLGRISPYKPAFPAGPTTGSLFDISFLNWFRVLYYFLPYGLFLFGVIYDGLVRKIKFFPSGFIGLGAVYLNYFISGAQVEDTDICGIPGMASKGSNIAPQNVLFNTTVLSYIASYITASNPDSSAYAATSWIGVAVGFILNAAMYYADKCYGDGTKWKLAFMGSFTPLFYALAGGMLIGGGSGALIATYVTGDTSGVGIGSESKQILTQTSGPAMAPTSDTAGAGKCSPTGDDDQFVCEAYKNGELVTSTIVE
jgi:hypothetical protein